MVNKDNVIGMLEKALAKEDETIVAYAQDFLPKLKDCSELNDDEKEEVAGIMDSLITDTRRHRGTIVNLINKIKEDSRESY